MDCRGFRKLFKTFYKRHFQLLQAKQSRGWIRIFVYEKYFRNNVCFRKLNSFQCLIKTKFSGLYIVTQIDLYLPFLVDKIGVSVADYSISH